MTAKNCGNCHRCVNHLRGAWPPQQFGMIVCPNCGNKRCPKASDHDLPCTNSNKSGQIGSVYA